MRLHPEKPEAGPWRRVGDAELTALVAPLLDDGRGVVLVDGRSGGGKSTVAARLAERVDNRPPGWVARGRQGSVAIPVHVRVLVLEGVGAGRAALASEADALVWVQSDRSEARERGLRRDVALGRTPEEAERFWDGWAPGRTTVA